ncbi:L,D-transpeptidase family protein [Pelistega indica]|uniref:L,D-transpeptidase family protein n=1 Tax=Pelistega indica TaxID=1414851 RepID=UPI000412CCD2|nr:L,D-transpeptidase family protein [Pelistega indica]
MKRWLIIAALVASTIVGALAWANHHENPLPANVAADLVVVEKAKRQLLLYSQGQLLKSYAVSLGRVPVGAKEREGDKKTPEGRYLIDYRKADSAYFRALHISYPSVADTEAAKIKGVSPGSAIMIHGIRNGLGWVGSVGFIALLTGRLDVLRSLITRWQNSGGRFRMARRSSLGRREHAPEGACN